MNEELRQALANMLNSQTRLADSQIRLAERQTETDLRQTEIDRKHLRLEEQWLRDRGAIRDEMDQILSVLHEHTHMLQKLPEAIQRKIGFNQEGQVT